MLLDNGFCQVQTDTELFGIGRVEGVVNKRLLGARAVVGDLDQEPDTVFGEPGAHPQAPTLREVTSIVVLENGRVTERGTHDDLVERNGGYARLYRLHHTGTETSVFPGANTSTPQDFGP